MAEPVTQRTPKERTTRIALRLGDEDVSGLWVHDLEMRIGSVPVRLGGIGGVGTKAEHRKKGYAKKVLEDAGVFMGEAGYDVAVLFGIRDFYPKFGYAVCMAEYSVRLSTKYAEHAADRFSFSPSAEGDLEAVRQLYEETNARRTGSVVRRQGVWNGFRMGSRHGAAARCAVARHPSGDLESYVVLDDNADETICAELAARSPEGYEAALRFLANDAVEKRAGEIGVVCPYDHPFVECASRFGARIEIVRQRCGGPMGRAVRQRSLLEKLAPVFAERLRGSGFRRGGVALHLTTERGGDTITFDGERVLVSDEVAPDSCALPAPGLMQLAMGYCDAAMAGARCEGQRAAALVNALFPRQEAHMWRPDRF